MQKEISPKEFSEWIAYNKLCPIGLERFDYLSTLIAHSCISSFGGTVDWEDIMPDWDFEYNKPAKQERKNEAMFKKAKMSAKLINKKFLIEERKRLGIK